MIERTEGNPFFMEETVRSLVETGALAGERGAYRLQRQVQALQIPATARAMLAARIDRLEPEDKRLLQAAAVIGTDVPFEPLRAVAEQAEERLRRGLARLQATEFLYETRLFPEVEYTFKHALTHEVAYGSLLAERRRVSARQRLMLVLEDLQWADDSSLGLVSFLAHHLQRWPVLLALTAREDELVDAPLLGRLLADLRREPHFVHISLGPLSEHDTAELVRLVAGPVAAAQEEAERRLPRIWAASRGNPFMVVEWMRALDEGLPVAAGAGLPVPERVGRLVAARLDRLDPRAREVVSAAAAIGSRFPLRLAARVAGLEERAASKAVEDLLRRRVLQEVAGELDFAHDWIRHVAYSALSGPHRQSLHRGIAAASSEVGAGGPLAHPGTLGVHYREAHDWAQAADHFQRAGHDARMRGAVREAAGWFAEALGALARLPQDVEAVRRALVDTNAELAQAVLVLGEIPRMGRLWAEAEALARALGDRGRHSQALTGLASHAWYDARFAEGIAHATRALEIAEAQDDRERLVWAAFTLAQNRAAVGEPREAVRLIRPLVECEAGALSRRLQTEWGSLEVICLGWLALWLASVGELGETMARADRCIAAAHASGVPQAHAYADFYRALVAHVRGDLDLAAELLERARALSDREGLVMRAALCAVRRAQVLAELGRVDPEALERAARGLAMQQRMAMKVNRSMHRASWAAALLAAGQVSDARREAGHALAVARADGQRAGEAAALALLGRVAAAGGGDPDLEAARGFLASAPTVATALAMRPLEARCRLEPGLLSRRAGQLAAARAHLEAAAMFRKMDMPFWLKQAAAVSDDLG